MQPRTPDATPIDTPMTGHQPILSDMNDRTREVFRRVVEGYLTSGEPVGSRNISVGIAMAQMLGFPATYLIANEIATAVTNDEGERAFVLKKIMPAYVVAGFASVTSISIIIAGIFVDFLK